jgi:uncharacterized protein YndB with AHSA1/START domain
MTSTPNPSDTADREIVISRTFDAPRELVFDAFTDARHASAWYGPDGFTTTTERQELRTGGEWVFTMHGPDGTDFPNWIRYREVVRPERLVYEHGGRTPDAPVHFHVTVTFTDLGGGRTALTMRSVFPTAESRRLVVERYGAIEGGHQTLARLAAHLGPQPAGTADPHVLITRTVTAPRALVFQAWTDALALRRWYAPAGCELTACEIDVRPGGSLRLCIRTPTGYECWCRGTYREIVAGERLVFSLENTDAQGVPLAQGAGGMDPEWPTRTVVTVLFADDAGGTRMTLHQSASERVARRTGAHPGWLSMLDGLGRHLAGG